MSRDLDALIAERIFGYTGKIGFAYFAPAWTETLEHAWELIDLLNVRGIEVVVGCFPGRAYEVELRRWRDRRDEGVPGDPHTHRSRETFLVKHGANLPTVIGEAFLESGIKADIGWQRYTR